MSAFPSWMAMVPVHAQLVQPNLSTSTLGTLGPGVHMEYLRIMTFPPLECTMLHNFEAD